MNMQDTQFAEPPTDHRTDTPEPLDISTAPAVERDTDLIEKFLAGSPPHNDPEADPLYGIDPDAIKEYERWMDELRAIRENKQLRDIGLDPEYEL